MEEGEGKEREGEEEGTGCISSCHDHTCSSSSRCFSCSNFQSTYRGMLGEERQASLQQELISDV